MRARLDGDESSDDAIEDPSPACPALEEPARTEAVDESSCNRNTALLAVKTMEPVESNASCAVLDTAGWALVAAEAAPTTEFIQALGLLS